MGMKTSMLDIHAPHFYPLQAVFATEDQDV
jgi:hypothetical protein